MELGPQCKNKDCKAAIRKQKRKSFCDLWLGKNFLDKI